MLSLRSQIGPLATIFAFEAAGRLGNFTAAAEELGVTQAAVSKQIAALEERLSVQLFVRRHRHVELTRAGQQLSEICHDALSAIARTMDDVRKAEPKPLTVALSASLSRFWMMPRMPDFRRRHPDIALRIIAQDEPDGVGAASADLLVRYASRSWDDPAAIRLFGAKVVAMASPGFLRSRRLEDAADTASAPLIHYDTPGRGWISWNDWGRIALPGHRLPPPTLFVSSYHEAVLAAQQGQGIVLVWKVEDGTNSYDEGLIPVPGPAIEAPGSFYLVTLTPERRETRAAAEWFSEQYGTQ